MTNRLTLITVLASIMLAGTIWSWIYESRASKKGCEDFTGTITLGMITLALWFLIADYYDHFG